MTNIAKEARDHPFPSVFPSIMSWNIWRRNMAKFTITVPKNIPKPSMLPASNHFQYAPSFIGMYQHLFIRHLLHATDFQHPLPINTVNHIFKIGKSSWLMTVCLQWSSHWQHCRYRRTDICQRCRVIPIWHLQSTSSVVWEGQGLQSSTIITLKFGFKDG